MSIKLVLFCWILFVGINIACAFSPIGFNSEEYSDEVYRQLDVEYELEKDKLESLENQDGNASNGTLEGEAPSYLAELKRLQCENPWFWNAFKCLWLDVRERNYVKRTKKNAVVVALIIGPPIVMLILLIISTIVGIIFLRSRARSFKAKIQEIRNKYEPGRMLMKDGTVKKYKPTKEEMDAFHNVISTLVTVV